MKISAKLFYVMLLALSSFLLVGCFGTTPIDTELAPPTNVVVTDGVVSWTAVSEATGYTVFVGATSYNVTTTSFDLKTLTLDYGTHMVHVITVKGDKLSLPSSTVEYVLQVTTLAAPTGVTLTNGVVTWNAVPNAVSYIVKVGTTSHPVTERTLNLLNLSLAVGTYSVRVVAVTGTAQSPESTAVSYVKSEAEPTTLEQPTNVVLSDGVLTWNAVANATSYVVRVGATNHTVTTTTFNLNTLELATGEYNVTVKAVRGSLESVVSATHVFVVETLVVDPENIVAILLAMIDFEYVPDMTEDDFEWDYEYSNYVRTVTLVTVFSDAALEVEMTPENIVAMFEHMMGMPYRMDEATSATALKAEIDSYSGFGLSAQNVSYVVMEVAMATMEMAIEQMEEEYLYELDYIENSEAKLQALQDDPDYQAIYQKLVFYVGTENLALLDEFLTSFSEYQFYNELNAFRAMAQEVVWNHSNPWYWNYPTEYTYMFYDIIMAAADAEDDDFLESLATDWEYLDPLQSLLEEVHDLKWRAERIDEMEYRIEMLTNMHTTMIENRQLFMDSMKTVMNYMQDVYTTMPLTLFAMLDQMVGEGFITMEEYLLLKDEIISVLQQTVPSSEEFAKVYLSLMYAGSAIGEMDLVKATQNAALIGEASNITARLGLAFLAYIDAETVEEIMTKFMEVSQAEGADLVGSIELLVGGIELLVYVGNYIDGFLATQQVLIDELEALEMEEFVEDTIRFILSFLKQQAAADMSEEELALLEQLLDEAILDIDVYRAGLSFLMGIGVDVINEFLTSEGYFFIELFTLIQSGVDLDSEIAVREFAVELEVLFGDFAKYNMAIFGGMDLEAIESVLRMGRVPLLFALATEQDVDLEDAILLFEDLVVPVATVLHGMIQIELAVVNALETLGIFTEVSLLEGLDFPIIVMIGVVLLADGVLTVDIEALLYDTIDIVVLDILKHPVINSMLEMSEEDLDDMVAYILDTIGDTIINVREVSGFDFENMTEDELLQLVGIFEMFMGPEEPVPDPEPIS